MQGFRDNLFMRDDTFLGICQGLGDDFGFNPLWLRLILAVLLLWNPAVVVGTYLGLGAIVMVSRLLYPNPKHSKGTVVANGRSQDDHAIEPMAAAA